MCIGDAALLFGLFQNNLRLSTLKCLHTGTFWSTHWSTQIPLHDSPNFRYFCKTPHKATFDLLCIKFDSLHSSL